MQFGHAATTSKNDITGRKHIARCLSEGSITLTKLEHKYGATRFASDTSFNDYLIGAEWIIAYARKWQRRLTRNAIMSHVISLRRTLRNRTLNRRNGCFRTAHTERIAKSVSAITPVNSAENSNQYSEENNNARRCERVFARHGVSMLTGCC
ncbi:hypothetical protein ALP53_200044 [Pseudomonas savastanoi pv. phaseolicola]|nr:hypothetical protein ALP53_200044 [Pseudomonas savastanoi pv. phaseolicola]